MAEHPGYNTIYTDGSFTENITTGSAFVLNDTIFKYKLNPINNNYTAEAIAILKCLQHIQQEKISKIIICSDSNSVIQAVKSNKTTKNHIINAIKNLTLELNRNKIKIMWIPGHTNIKGNEIADVAAKDAAVNGIELNLINEPDFINLIEKQSKLTWNATWTLTQNNKLKEIKSEIAEWATANQPQNRTYETVLTRLRIGHTKLTHSYLLSRSDQPICDMCNVPVTVPHLLINCQKTIALRKTLNLPTQMEQILSDDQAIVKNLYKYLKAANTLYQI